MTSVEIVTKEDLRVFKQELLAELERVLARYAVPAAAPKRWLKTYEVRKLLGLSAGTLQTMRNNGTLRYSMIGKLAFYDYEEVVALVERGRKG